MEFVRKAKHVFYRLVKRLIKDVSLGLCYPIAYRKAAKHPVAPEKVIFLENKSSTLPDSYRVLHDCLTEGYSFEVRFVSLGQNRVRLRRYYLNCWNAVKDIATAKYVFLNDASDLVSCLPLRDETKVVQLWHACGAFKKWGMSTAELKFGGTRKDLLRHPFYKNLSLVTVSSPEVVWAYVEAMVLENQPEIVKPIGVSRTDLFFDAEHLAKARSHIEELVPLACNKRVILYAPTFRGRVASAEGPDRIDIPRFKEAFGDDSVLLIKHHPFVKKPHRIPEGCEGFAYDVSGDLDIDELLCVADVCISDYSSLVFEYSLFDRPMVFFAYDIDEYNDWRGFYYDYDELTPGPVFSDNESMVDYLQHLEERFDVGRVRAFREKFMGACDGHATERVCEEVFGEALEAYRKRTAREVLGAKNPDGIDISIVIPAYNAMPEFTKTLESLVGQTYDLSRMEVIVTDDCSSDGTWDEVQRFATRYPELFVLERLDEPSGSPAKPRNVGLAKARGTYVFFLDADDWLGERAVEKMLDHAVDWGSDVLLVKMKGENGREVPKSMFTHNQPKADPYLSKVMWSFAPLKLFKRSLVSELRFPAFMPEDISFVLRAYCSAETVSVAADYDYYHVSSHEEDRHASLSSWDDVESNLEAYRDIFGYIDAVVPHEKRNKVLMRRLFRRDIHNSLVSAVREESKGGKAQALNLIALARPYYEEDMYKTCPVPKRLVLDSAFFGSLEELVRVVEAGEGLASRCSYGVVNGRASCRLPEDVGTLCLDISEALSLRCKVEQVFEADGAVKLLGSFALPSSFGNARCSLVFAQTKDRSQIELPVLFEVSDERVEVESGIPSVDMLWTASVPFARLFELKPGRWQMSLLLRLQGWEKAVRLESVQGLGVKRLFSSIEASNGFRLLSFHLGPRGDLRVDVRRA